MNLSLGAARRPPSGVAVGRRATQLPPPMGLLWGGWVGGWGGVGSGRSGSRVGSGVGRGPGRCGWVPGRVAGRVGFGAVGSWVGSWVLYAPARAGCAVARVQE